MNEKTYTKAKLKTLKKTKSLDTEWIRLIQEAKEIGLTIDEVKAFFLSQSKPLFKD